MNPFEMVVAIVIVVTAGRVLQALFGRGHNHQPHQLPTSSDDPVHAENAQLRGELARMKERLAVLERVITDNHSSSDLDREIEKLRDRT
jgi:hypothetical protein